MEDIAESRLLRLPAVLELTGLKKSSIYQKVKNQAFPQPVKLGDGARAVAWHSREVHRWINDLPRATE